MSKGKGKINDFLENRTLAVINNVNASNKVFQLNNNSNNENYKMILLVVK